MPGAKVGVGFGSVGIRVGNTTDGVGWAGLTAVRGGGVALTVGEVGIEEGPTVTVAVIVGSGWPNKLQPGRAVRQATAESLLKNKRLDFDIRVIL